MTIILPAWLRACRDAQVGVASAVRWYSDAEIDQATHGKGSQPPYTRMTDDELQWATTQYQGKLRVGEGPTTLDRQGITHYSALWIDQDQPDDLLLALTAKYPPFLWISLGQDLSRLAAVLPAYFSPHIPPEATLSQVAWLVLGTTDLLNTDMRGLENHFILNPFCEHLQWGSAHATDPYPDQVSLAGPDLITTRRLIQQASDKRHMTSFRTVHSRSIFRLINYDDDLFITELRYRPATETALVSRFNAHLDKDFPPDVPIDLIATLLGMANWDLERLRRMAVSEREADDQAGLLAAVETMAQVQALREADVAS
ncbi:MAG: hypothetical protein H0U76_02550 [Ktedonobacteraceae bacterium]|nr:hypothetical protein [Ktedonobacteraceae bacterium]